MLHGSAGAYAAALEVEPFTDESDAVALAEAAPGRRGGASASRGLFPHWRQRKNPVTTRTIQGVFSAQCGQYRYIFTARRV